MPAFFFRLLSFLALPKMEVVGEEDRWPLGAGTPSNVHVTIMRTFMSMMVMPFESLEDLG